MTIAGILCDAKGKEAISRAVTKVSKKFNERRLNEIKGSSCNTKKSLVVARELYQRCKKSEGYVELFAITVKKINAFNKFQGKEEYLYNYMIKLVLESIDFKTTSLVIQHDKRNVRMPRHQAIDYYLRRQLGGYSGLKFRYMKYERVESHANPFIQAADWVANFTWRHYQNGDSEAFNLLKDIMINRELFFRH